MSGSCKNPQQDLIQIGEPAAPGYWRSLEEARQGAHRTGEFPGGLPGRSQSAESIEPSRRNFLSLMGFTIAAAGLTGCRAPVQHAIPMLAGSDDLTPGVGNWYASSCRGCPSACSPLVKLRGGRTI